MDRESGYYWVRYGGEWDVFQLWLYSSTKVLAWYRAGTDLSYREEDFDEIGERIEPPKESK
jgi:hypothetical protein